MLTMYRTNRKRRQPDQIAAEAVWVALSGAKQCKTCGSFQVSGKMVSGALFCDECDSTLHFDWPTGTTVWHA
jgi:hypothetical protein